MHAVQFIRHHDRIREVSGSAEDDPDTIFGECLASLQAWKHELVAASGASGCTASSTPLHPRSFLKDVLGKETEHLNVAVEEVEKWVNKRVQKQSQSKRLAVTKALEKLEDIAGGKSTGRSWKDNLNDTSSYDDVQREAAYHFAVKEDETPPNRCTKSWTRSFWSSRQQRKACGSSMRTWQRPRCQAQGCQRCCQ